MCVRDGERETERKRETPAPECKPQVIANLLYALVPQKALCGGIPGDGFGIWDDFGAILRGTVAKS